LIIKQIQYKILPSAKKNTGTLLWTNVNISVKSYGRSKNILVTGRNILSEGERTNVNNRDSTGEISDLNCSW